LKKGQQFLDLKGARENRKRKAKTKEEKKHWDQISVARRLGIPVDTYRKYESTNNGIGEENFKLIKNEFPEAGVL